MRRRDALKLLATVPVSSIALGGPGNPKKVSLSYLECSGYCLCGVNANPFEVRHWDSIPQDGLKRVRRLLRTFMESGSESLEVSGELVNPGRVYALVIKPYPFDRIESLARRRIAIHRQSHPESCIADPKWSYIEGWNKDV